MAIELDATVQAERRPTVDATATSPGTGRARLVASRVGPGTRLAHFRLERPLGHGGMGEVWLATDLALDRSVAIKLLPADVAGDPVRRERLLREARAQARLNHPNVCHIYFIGEDDGQLFFAMEHVAGKTLAQRLDDGPLTTDDAIELARMAAQGLREAHKAGFTHRDVKPSNLMIDGNQALKVMDFGLVSSSPDGERLDGDAPVAASALVGTPLYMAPEQGRGEAVDLRADIYALGATLHHMISGAPPFVGDSAGELLSRHETGARPSLAGAGRTRRTVGVIDRVIAKMMAKRPEDRFASYDELIDALDRASTARTRPAGFWVRGIAAFIDFMFAALLVMPLIATLFADVDEAPFIFWSCAIVYPVSMARWGTTVGRALLDLEVVDHRTAKPPRLMAGFTRELVEYGPFVAGLALGHSARALGWPGLVVDIGTVISILGFGYPFVEVLRATWLTVDKRTIWDHAAKTQVRYRVRR